MMSDVPLETCWAFNKLWNNKFCYKAASCWYFYWVIYDARFHEYQMQGTLHEDLFTLMTVSQWILPTMRNVSDKSCWESQNTFYSQLLFPENRGVYTIAWKHTVQPERPQTTWRMRCAGWITKAADTHSEYVILTGVSTTTIVTRKHLNVTFTRTQAVSIKIPYRTCISSITKWRELHCPTVFPWFVTVIIIT
jgi:hypothetical protein